MSILLSFKNLSKFERALWLFSIGIITAGFLLSQSLDILTLIASLIGVTALIFVAKGDVLGQILTIVFSVLYAIISWRFHYFGEMITYLGMTAPIAGMAVVTWRKNPYAEKEVKVSALTVKKTILLFVLAGLVTWGFYYILAYLGTTNLVISTISITTSFLASALTMLRSPNYALAYAANDVVLIVLWVLATLEDITFLPVIICFCMFFLNDIYGFVNWRRMKKGQQTNQTPAKADVLSA